MDTQLIEKRLWANPVGTAVTWRMLRPVIRVGGPVNLDADVLHMGCGSGRFTEMLALAHPQWRITALDSDTELLAWAHRRLYQYGPRISITRAYPPHLPYPDASFDLVIAVNVWQRLSQWRAVTVHAARVLRPNAILVIAEAPNVHMRSRTHRGGEDRATLTPIKVAVAAAGLTLVDSVTVPTLGFRLLALRPPASRQSRQPTSAAALQEALR